MSLAMRLFLNTVIQRLAERLPTYSRLLSFSRRYWRLFCCGMLLTVLSGMLDGLIVWLLKPIIDHGLVQRDMLFIKWLPALVIAIGFFRGAFPRQSPIPRSREAQNRLAPSPRQGGPARRLGAPSSPPGVPRVLPG